MSLLKDNQRETDYKFKGRNNINNQEKFSRKF